MNHIPIDYTIISQNLRLLLGLGLNNFSWAFWTIANKPYKPRPIIKADLDGGIIEYASMKDARFAIGLSVKELRSKIKRPDKTLLSDGYAIYFREAWIMQGEKHWLPVQGIFRF